MNDWDEYDARYEKALEAKDFYPELEDEEDKWWEEID